MCLWSLEKKVAIRKWTVPVCLTYGTLPPGSQYYPFTLLKCLILTVQAAEHTRRSHILAAPVPNWSFWPNFVLALFTLLMISCQA